jgi:hypothetical protein
MKKKTKSEVCKEIGANILIDDALSNANDCADNGIHVILFDFERYINISTCDCRFSFYLFLDLTCGANCQRVFIFIEI